MDNPQSDKPKLLALHGFLGGPKDFDFLKTDFDVFAPDLRELVSLPVEEIASILLKEKRHMLGYSFGARLGARLKLARPDAAQKCLLLSGHMGLKNETDRAEREAFEQGMISRLRESTCKEFESFWNSLALFQFDDPINLEGDLKSWIPFFSHYGLSKQPYLLKELAMYSQDIFFAYGELDAKYKSYAEEELKEFEVFWFNCGHRVLGEKESVKNKLKLIINEDRDIL